MARCKVDRTLIRRDKDKDKTLVYEKVVNIVFIIYCTLQRNASVKTLSEPEAVAPQAQISKQDENNIDCNEKLPIQRFNVYIIESLRPDFRSSLAFKILCRQSIGVNVCFGVGTC